MNMETARSKLRRMRGSIEGKRGRAGVRGAAEAGQRPAVRDQRGWRAASRAELFSGGPGRRGDRLALPRAAEVGAGGVERIVEVLEHILDADDLAAGEGAGVLGVADGVGTLGVVGAVLELAGDGGEGETSSLWRRLTQLDRCCRIVTENIFQHTGDPTQRWSVMIRSRTRPETDAVRVTGEGIFLVRRIGHRGGRAAELAPRARPVRRPPV